MILSILADVTVEGQALGPRRSFEDQLAFFQGLGANWVEVWPANFENGISPENRYEGKDIAKARDLPAKYGFGVSCVGMPLAFYHEEVGNVDSYVAGFRAAVDTAAELGAKLVSNYCFHWVRGPYNPDIEPFVSMLRQVVPYAADRGVAIVLENEASDTTGTVLGMSRVMEAVGHGDDFGTTYDPANYYHASEEAWPYAYEKLKPYIKYVHIKNARLHDITTDGEEDAGPAMPRKEGWFLHYCPIVEGAVNIEGLLNQLKEDDYTGFCTIEPKVPPDQMEKYYRLDLDYLRKYGVRF